jgi:small subunit ribosomal protein S21
MAEVNVKELGSLEAALKKFKKMSESTLKDLKKRQYYRKPSIKKGEKRANARKYKLRYGF